MRKHVAVAVLAAAVVLGVTPYRAAAQAYRAREFTWNGLPDGMNAGFARVEPDGSAGVGNVYRSEPYFSNAFYYDFTTGTRTTLHPEGYLTSNVSGIHRGHQIGFALSGTRQTHAALWSGTAASMVNINPVGATHSAAYSTTGLFSVGNSSYGDANDRATLWSHRNGTHFTTDITPPGFRQGIAFDIDGISIVGAGGENEFGKALYWPTPDTHVVLAPPSAAYSVARAIRGNEQVGWAGIGLWFAHAMLWRGSAESAVDLNPPGFRYSDAIDTNGRQQVGWASDPPPNTGHPPNHSHAFVWSGTAESGIDLHALLEPGRFVSSEAGNIDDFGNIYGGAVDVNGVGHTIIWTPVPEPSGAGLCAGALLALLAERRRRRRGSAHRYAIL